ncbi:MAG: hypothetical protein HKM95_15655 [Inquilinus sp.]|nr:hypothetical protein [Inquilinus sp.]
MVAQVEPVFSFSVGAVLGRSFGIWFRNFIPFSLMSIIVTSPSFILAMATQPDLGSQSPAAGGGAVATFATIFVDLVVNALLVGALAYGTFQDLRGNRASIGEIVAHGFSVVPVVVGVALLVGLITFLGIIALVIPGIIAAVVLWVAVPVATVERPGVIASLSRSSELTRGHRWPCLGAIILITVVQFSVAALAGGAYALLAADTTILFTGTGYLFFEYILAAVITVFGSVAAAVAYHDLRSVKEGIGVNEIAAVFD